MSKLIYYSATMLSCQIKEKRYAFSRVVLIAVLQQPDLETSSTIKDREASLHRDFTDSHFPSQLG